MQIIDQHLEFKRGFTKRKQTLYIVNHHSVTAKDVDMAYIHNLHLARVKEGFIGVGYALGVDGDGKIYQGRPHWAIGAQVLRKNSYTVGIVAFGDFRTDTMSEAQINGMAEANRYLLGFYPSAQIVGHKQLQPTVCPGPNFPLGTIINRAKGIELQPAPTPKTPLKVYRTIGYGDKGEDVKLAQNLLIKAGFSVGKWGADGKFGNATRAAAIKFQRKYPEQCGKPDGVVGCRTWPVLLKFL